MNNGSRVHGLVKPSLAMLGTIKKIQFVFASLLLCLGSLFAIDNMRLGQQFAIDISWPAYMIATFAALLTIYSKPSHRWSSIWPPIILSTAVYCLSIIVAPNRLTHVTEHLLSCSLELGMVLVIVVHSFYLGKFLRLIGIGDARLDLSRALETIPLLEESHPSLISHFSLSKRHNRPLSIILIQPAQSSLDLLIQQRSNQQEILSVKSRIIFEMSHCISALLRQTDLLFRHKAPGQFIILCPDTTLRSTEQLTQRIVVGTYKDLKISLMTGTSSFPNTASTLEGLVLMAEAQLLLRTTPHDNRYASAENNVVVNFSPTAS